MPPTKPSHDFPGEITGAIRCLPIARPTKNAAVSSAKTVSSVTKISKRPSLGMSRRSIR